MSWFGGGKSSTEDAAPSSYEEPSYDYSASSGASAAAAAGPSSSVSEVQGMLMEEQQRAMIQQAIAKITAIAWDKCSASKPDSDLSSREKECIKNVTLAYLDTSVFVVHRLNKAG